MFYDNVSSTLCSKGSYPSSDSLFVINNPAEVHRIAGLTIEWMKAVKEKNPALYEEAKLELFVESWETGQDCIYRGD